MNVRDLSPPPGTSTTGAVAGRPPGRRTKRRNLALTFAVLGNATITFTTIRAGQVQLSDAFFLLAVVVVVVKMLTGDDSDLAPPAARKGSPLILVGALLLLTGGTLSSLRSWAPFESITVVVRFAWISLVWFWLMRTVCRTRDDLYSLLRAWKVSALLSSGAAILGMMGIAFHTAVVGTDRQTALAGHPNNLGGQLTATFALFLLAVPASRAASSRRARVSWLVSLALVSVAIASTGSMTTALAGASAAVAVGATLLLTRRPAMRWRRRSPLAPVFLLLVLAAGVLVLARSDLPVVERVTAYREGDVYVTGSVESRGERNSLVTGRFDDFLFIGLGLNGYSAPAVRNDDDPAAQNDPAARNFGVHNMHLGLLYQAGLPATAGAMLVLVTGARQLKGLLRRVDSELFAVTVGLIGCFVAVNVTSFFQPISFDRFFWMPVALTGCLWSVRRQELRAQAEARASTSVEMVPLTPPAASVGSKLPASAS